MIHNDSDRISLGKLLLCFALTMVLTACGAVHHEIKLNGDFTPQAGTNIEVGRISNETGQTFDITIEDMLREALNKNLKEKNLLSTGTAGHRLALSAKIVEYEEGDAFKRWLLPGWGTTVLSVQSDIMEGDRLVGTIEARRTVSAGGGYTIGAWKTIFNSVADDIVSDLRSKIPQVK
jgi:hypothetical protein